MAKKHYLLIAFSVIFIISFVTPEAYACSGGAPITISGLLSRSDYVVKAQVYEQDDANQNVILQIESYLAGGSGPKFLLLNSNEPDEVEYVLNGRSSGGDCLGLNRALEQFQSYYFFLRRDDNGGYSVVDTLFNLSAYKFASPHSTLEIHIDGGHENGGRIYDDIAPQGNAGIEVTETEFIYIIAEESSEQPAMPDTSYPYPLKAPLLIHTESNLYMLPVDWQPIVPITEPEYKLKNHWIFYKVSWSKENCKTENCFRISPDSLNVAMIQNDNTIRFLYDSIITGQELLFASTSDAVAIWNECELSIYTTGYPRLHQQWYQLEQINTLILNAEICVTHHSKATWTPDGRLLAYSDDLGIWLWDVYDADTQPRLIIPIDSSETLTPNYFSPLGRYLNFSRDNTSKNFDIVSGAVIADGIISPDDKVLINFEEQHGAFGYEICSLITIDCNTIWSELYLATFDEKTGEVSNVYFPTHIQKHIEWISKFAFIQIACVDRDTDLCVVYRTRTNSVGWYSSNIGKGFEFAYDHNQDLIAILKDDHTISIDGMKIDTKEWFDEAIINIEWLPSLFYFD